MGASVGSSSAEEPAAPEKQEHGVVGAGVPDVREGHRFFCTDVNQH